MQVWFLGWEDPLENEMATHSSILGWKFYGQRSLAGYNPWGHRVRHDWACMHANINATDSVYWFYIHTFYQCVVYFPIFMSLTSIFSFQLQRTPFSVSSKASLVDSLSFCFSGKVFLLHISGVSVSDKVFLAGNFFFQWTLWICYSTLFWPVGFLLRNLLIA